MDNQQPGRLAPKDAELGVPWLTATVLLINALQAFASKEIGWQNTETLFNDFLQRLERKGKLFITVKELEELLYACNMRAEDGKFFSPLNETYEQFLARTLPKLRVQFQQVEFNREYNMLTVVEPEGERTNE